MMPYERFEAWRLCHQLALEVYRVTKRYPATERFGLTNQTRRAAFSAAANIVEGSGKRGPREFRRFLDISLGSLVELGYWLLVARDLSLIDEATWQVIDAKRDRASRVTWGLYRSVKDKAVAKVA